jgi:NAD(P)H-hydrate epimerase
MSYIGSKMKVSTISQMRAMDKNAIELYGIEEILLMENAGLAVYFAILREMGDVSGKKFVIVCGPGNNGGDGLVVARKLHSGGAEATVFLMKDREEFKGVAKKNLEILQKTPVQISTISSLDQVEEKIAESDAIVDGVLGTGIVKDVTGAFRDVIDIVNRSGKPVFSVDIPSGISGDTGLVMGAAVKATYTISFGLPKVGNVVHPGYEHCGKLYVSHISFPTALYNDDSINVEICIPARLPKRPQDAHKGTFGEVLFVAGARGYYGAPLFSALGFLKAGGGYSRLATPNSVAPFIGSKGNEIVIMPQKETDSGSLSLEARDELLAIGQKMDMVVMGPGLSLNEETQELARWLAERIEKPLLVDGDGITAVSKDLGCLRKRVAPTILTPHTGEMSRITGLPVGDVRSKRIEIVQRMTKDLNAIIVLKEGISFVGYPDGRVFINMTGNSGMSTAGSGDVLTGSIAAMLGLGLDINEAVKAGVFVHGLAGDLATEQIGQDGMTAQDILDFMPAAVRYYRENYDRIRGEMYGKIIVI